MTNDYRPLPPKSIPERQISADSALAATAAAITGALLIWPFDASLASGLCFGCAIALVVDRVVRCACGRRRMTPDDPYPLAAEFRSTIVALAHASRPDGRLASHLLNRDLVDLMDYAREHPRDVTASTEAG